jgi:hypothetical protein
LNSVFYVRGHSVFNVPPAQWCGLIYLILLKAVTLLSQNLRKKEAQCTQQLTQKQFLRAISCL